MVKFKVIKRVFKMSNQEKESLLIFFLGRKIDKNYYNLNLACNPLRRGAVENTFALSNQTALLT